ncbi:MAG: GGDEF domain-containing protein [Chloroflexi bacterium]|nr:GGDEF domain-containing protein [Chloroflexota bacterium]
MLVLVILTDIVGDNRRGFYTILITGLVSLLVLAFGLNRAGRHGAAAHLTVACAILAPWGSIVLDPAIVRGDFVPLVYTVLSILLCSILLSVRTTVILSAIQFLMLLSLPFFVPATTFINWPSLMAFVFFTSALSIVDNFINRQDLGQIDRQIRQLVESEARLRELSVRDPLTGLFNRYYLEETLEREVRVAARNRRPLGIIIADLDHFKRFNDSHGHAAGDAVLRQVGAFLRKYIRETDFVCRYGGEEFVLIMPEASLQVMREHAELMLQEARHFHAEYEGQRLESVTLSLGVALFPDHGSTGAAVLAIADAALYRAKGAGRDRVVVADPAPV